MTYLDKLTSRKRYSAALATLVHRSQRSTCALALTMCVVSCSDSPDLSLGEEYAQPDEAEVTREMIRLIKEVSLERPKNDGLVKRFNQVKSLGCFDARFTVADALPEKLARGLFSKVATYPAILRFANASTEDDREKDLHGVSAKIPEITDADLTGGKTLAQHFLFNSYPALFAATPEDFLSFIEATADDRRWLYFLTHPKSLWILFKARDAPASPFDIRYWSTTPYRYGDDSTSAAKYSLKPCSTVTTNHPDQPDAGHLSSAMANHLQQAPACFELMVQFQSDAETMPIEDASVIWDEDVSPFSTVATIVVENQKFQDANSMAECEAMSFNPWHALSAHKPLGGMNRVRKELYDEIAEFRAQQNSQL